MSRPGSPIPALRHVSSTLARLASGGRLVAITGGNLSPEDPAWRAGFERLQERRPIVFSAAIAGPALRAARDHDRRALRQPPRRARFLASPGLGPGQASSMSRAIMTWRASAARSAFRSAVPRPASKCAISSRSTAIQHRPVDARRGSTPAAPGPSARPGRSDALRSGLCRLRSSARV